MFSYIFSFTIFINEAISPSFVTAILPSLTPQLIHHFTRPRPRNVNVLTCHTMSLLR